MPPKKPAADSAPPPQPTSSNAAAEETAAKKKPDAATMRKLTSHPSTAVMVREALKELDSRKGVSSQAIQKYIRLTYPSADGVMLKHLVRRALMKGLESGSLARPPSSTVTAGVQGRFRLVPTKEPKPKKENTDPNVEKAPKEAKEGVKRPQKTGAAKKKATDEDLKSTENLKPPRKTKKDEEAAPAKKPRAKKAEAKESGKESSDSTKTKAKLTKEPKTEKASQSKAATAAAADDDAPVDKPASRRKK